MIRSNDALHADWRSGNIECAALLCFLKFEHVAGLYHVVTMFVDELLISSLAFSIITRIPAISLKYIHYHSVLRTVAANLRLR